MISNSRAKEPARTDLAKEISRETEKRQIKNSEEKTKTKKESKTYNSLGHDPLDSQVIDMTRALSFRLGHDPLDSALNFLSRKKHQKNV